MLSDAFEYTEWNEQLYRVLTAFSPVDCPRVELDGGSATVGELALRAVLAGTAITTLVAVTILFVYVLFAD